MAEHELKIKDKFYQAKLDGLKPWEFRDARDRQFAVGDTVKFRETDSQCSQITNVYTGRECQAKILYIHAPLPDFCIFTHGPIEILK